METQNQELLRALFANVAGACGFDILELLKSGGLTDVAIRERLPQDPTVSMVREHLRRLRSVGLIVRGLRDDREGWWLSKKGFETAGDLLSTFIKDVPDTNCEPLEGRFASIFRCKKSIHVRERVQILESIAKRPASISDLCAKLEPAIPRLRLYNVMILFESANLASSRKVWSDRYCKIRVDKFSATSLGVEVLRVLRNERNAAGVEQRRGLPNRCVSTGRGAGGLE